MLLALRSEEGRGKTCHACGDQIVLRRSRTWFPIGRVAALGAIALGLLMIQMGASLLPMFDSAVTPLFLGHILGGAGAAMLILPGASVSVAQYRSEDVPAGFWVQQAPKAHKVFWVLAGLAGFLYALVRLEM